MPKAAKATHPTRTPATRDVYEIVSGKGRPTLLEVKSTEELRRLLQTELKLDDVTAQSVAHLATSKGEVRFDGYRVTHLGSMVFVASNRVEKVEAKPKAPAPKQAVPAPHQPQEQSQAAVIVPSSEEGKRAEEPETDSLFS